jgi:hypothetical protein
MSAGSLLLLLPLSVRVAGLIGFRIWGASTVLTGRFSCFAIVISQTVLIDALNSLEIV